MTFCRFFLRGQLNDITEVEALGGVAFDFLVIAALEEEQAVKIRSELVLQEIPESKILWRAPLEL